MNERESFGDEMSWSDIIGDDIISYTHPCSCENVFHYQLYTVVPRRGEGRVPGHITRCRGNREALEQGADRSRYCVHTRTEACTHARTHTTHLEDNVLLLLLCEGGSGGSHTGVGVGCWHQHLRVEGVRRRRKSEGEKVGGGK